MSNTSPAATRTRPAMQSLDDYLKGEQAPPKPPVNRRKVFIGAAASIVVLAVLGYFLVLGERAGNSTWVQLGKNLDQREQLR